MGKRYIRDMQRRAPSIRTPRFTRGDVLATMDPDTWIHGDLRSPYYCAMWTAFAALAACARITPYRAVTFTLAHYDANALRVSTDSNRYSYPVLLLPIALAALERYLKLRRPLGGTQLFVSENGNPVRSASASKAFRQLAAQYGLYGDGIVDELLAFYDRCFVGETDRAAVIALKRGRARIDDNVPRTEIVAAKDDLDRLWTILRRCHKLTGAAGRWIGGHGKAKIAREMRLFKPVRSRTPITEFMRTDPVCALLLRQDWTGRNLIAQRAKLIEKYFAYLSDQRDRGLLRSRQIAYLLNLSSDRIHDYLTRHRRAAEIPAERKAREHAEAYWEARILEMYEARPEGEPPGVFYQRALKLDPDYPFDWTFVPRALKKGGVAPAQLAAKATRTKRRRTA